MDNSRAIRLTLSRSQVRSLKQREHRLLFLLDKSCTGNRAEAEAELVRVRRHIQGAETALIDDLRCDQRPISTHILTRPDKESHPERPFLTYGNYRSAILMRLASSLLSPRVCERIEDAYICGFVTPSQESVCPRTASCRMNSLSVRLLPSRNP